MVHSRSACIASLVALCLTVGCVTEEKPKTTGEYVLEMCGPMPQPPEFKATYYGDDTYYFITHDTYQELKQYREYVNIWSICASTLP